MGKPLHPEFPKLALRMMGITLIRGGILFLISLGLSSLGHPNFSLWFAIASTAYIGLDFYLSGRKIEEIRNARPLTQYLLFKSPEGLISHRERIIEELLENENEQLLEDKE